MRQTPTAVLAESALFLAASEPSARRRVSKANGLRSGTIPVLAAVGALAFGGGGSIRPSYLLAAHIASATLVREYMRELVQRGMVERYTRRGRAYLLLTPKGASVCAEYQRYLLGGAREFKREQCIRQGR